MTSTITDTVHGMGRDWPSSGRFRFAVAGQGAVALACAIETPVYGKCNGERRNHYPAPEELNTGENPNAARRRGCNAGVQGAHNAGRYNQTPPLIKCVKEPSVAGSSARAANELNLGPLRRTLCADGNRTAEMPNNRHGRGLTYPTNTNMLSGESEIGTDRNPVGWWIGDAPYQDHQARTVPASGPSKLIAARRDGDEPYEDALAYRRPLGVMVDHPIQFGRDNFRGGGPVSSMVGERPARAANELPLTTSGPTGRGPALGSPAYATAPTLDISPGRRATQLANCRPIFLRQSALHSVPHGGGNLDLAAPTEFNAPSPGFTISPNPAGKDRELERRTPPPLAIAPNTGAAGNERSKYDRTLRHRQRPGNRGER